MALFHGWKVIHVRRRNPPAIHLSALDDVCRRAGLYAGYLADHDRKLELWYEDCLDPSGARLSDLTLDRLAAFLEIERQYLDAGSETATTSPPPCPTIGNRAEVE
jgi:hypothetical protein